MYLLGRKSLSCFFAPRHVGNGENLSSHPDDSEFTPQGEHKIQRFEQPSPTASNLHEKMSYFAYSFRVSCESNLRL